MTRLRDMTELPNEEDNPVTRTFNLLPRYGGKLGVTREINGRTVRKIVYSEIEKKSDDKRKMPREGFRISVGVNRNYLPDQDPKTELPGGKIEGVEFDIYDQGVQKIGEEFFPVTRVDVHTELNVGDDADVLYGQVGELIEMEKIVSRFFSPGYLPDDDIGFGIVYGNFLDALSKDLKNSDFEYLHEESLGGVNMKFKFYRLETLVEGEQAFKPMVWFTGSYCGEEISLKVDLGRIIHGTKRLPEVLDRHVNYLEQFREILVAHHDLDVGK
jgi:hypothetical protein